MTATYAPATFTNACGATAAAATDDIHRTVTFYGLTPCCQASGKGSADASTGVVCRACYREVSAKYGTSGWLSIREAVRDAKCKAGDECADYILHRLEEASAPAALR